MSYRNFMKIFLVELLEIEMSDLQKERDREIISYFHDLDDIWHIILSKSIKILITENFEHFDI